MSKLFHNTTWKYAIYGSVSWMALSLIILLIFNAVYSKSYRIENNETYLISNKVFPASSVGKDTTYLFDISSTSGDIKRVPWLIQYTFACSSAATSADSQSFATLYWREGGRNVQQAGSFGVVDSIYFMPALNNGSWTAVAQTVVPRSDSVAFRIRKVISSELKVDLSRRYIYEE